MKAVEVMPRSVRSRMNWCTVVGGLLTLGLVALFVSEIPSLRREARLMRM